MDKFVLDIKDGQFKLNNELANLIYKNLSKIDQMNIDFWAYNNGNKRSRAETISLLYGTLSLRRRMCKGLVKGVEEYNSKHKKSNFKVHKLKPDTKYICECFNANGSEYLVEYNATEHRTIDSVDIELWRKCISIQDEMKMNENDISEKEALKTNIEEPSNNLWIRIKRLFKQIKRWIKQKVYGLESDKSIKERLEKK